MNLYTYIFEFRKGTYITQVQAENELKSVSKWLNTLENDIDEIYQLSGKSILEIKQKLIDEKPGLISKVQNVWSFAFTIKQGYGFVTIVKTAKRYIDKDLIIELLKEQAPNSEKQIKQLQYMAELKWIKNPYIRFVDNVNANKKDAEWQFKKNIVLEHKTEGTIILDILKDGEIGGFELVKELD